MRFASLLFFVVALAAANADAATYYVRKTGNDGSSGTAANQAWLTIQRAALSATAGDTVYVGAGTYSEYVQPANDGTAVSPVKFVADTSGAFTGDAGTVLLNGGANERALEVDSDDYHQWFNFKFTGGTQSAVLWRTSIGGYLEGCEMYSSASDGIVNRAASLTVHQCFIRDNAAYGIEVLDGGTVVVTQCTIQRNTSGGIGAYGHASTNTTIKRSLISHNSVHGIYLDQGVATVINVITSNNAQHGLCLGAGTMSVTVWHLTSAYNTQSGVTTGGGTLSIRNSILAFNSNYGLNQAGGTITHTHNCIAGNSFGNLFTATWSTAETSGDPRFWSATCLELQDGSPCINTGTSSAGAAPDDFEGVARPAGGGIDMGCYETVVLSYSNLTSAYTALSPYAWWRLNDTSGTTATEQIASRHGTYQNGTLLGKVGAPVGGYNKAAEFDGANDKVNLGTAINPTVTKMSFVGWMRADDFDVSNADLLAKSGGATDASYFWSLGTVTSGGQNRLQFRFRASSTTAVAVGNSANLGPLAWVFVSGVYDGSAIIVYQDGEEVGRAALSGTPDLSSGTSAAIGDSPIGGRPFDGLIDEVAIFTKALKPREIAAMYAAALKGSKSGTVSIPKLWGVDEDDGQLFAFTNYNSTASLVNYGTLKWNNAGVNTNFAVDSNVSSLAINRYAKAYFTSDTALGSTAGPVLLSFDLASASTTLPNVVAIVGTIPTTTEIRGLRFDPTTEELYAIRNDGWLFVINPANAAIVRTVGQVTGIGEVVTTGEDLVFDPYGNLYVMDDTDDEFYRVNKSTGAILEVTNNGGSIGTVQGIAWDAVNGRILATETSADFIISAAANLSSASYLTGLSSLGLTAIEAIDFVPSEGRTGIWPAGVRVLRWKETK